jgi:hypothetical protein
MTTTFAKAKALLLSRGWIKGSFEGAGTPEDPGRPRCLCLVGAINVAEGREPSIMFDAENGVYSPAEKAVLTALGVPLMSEVFDWNDTPERTLEEVIALLDLLDAENPNAPG